VLATLPTKEHSQDWEANGIKNKYSVLCGFKKPPVAGFEYMQAFFPFNKAAHIIGLVVHLRNFFVYTRLEKGRF
jgi:hypothetical protein